QQESRVAVLGDVDRQYHFPHRRSDPDGADGTRRRDVARRALGRGHGRRPPVVRPPGPASLGEPGDGTAGAFLMSRIVRPLDRYVFGEFWKIFIVTALGFPILLIVIDLTDHVDQYLNKKIPIQDIALSYAYWIPDS